jgi:hypothetical protein
MRALLPLGQEAVRRGHAVLLHIDLVRVNERVLSRRSLAGGRRRLAWMSWCSDPQLLSSG